MKNNPLFVTESPLFVTERALFVTDSPLFVTDSPLFVIERAQMFIAKNKNITFNPIGVVPIRFHLYAL